MSLYSPVDFRMFISCFAFLEFSPPQKFNFSLCLKLLIKSYLSLTQIIKFAWFVLVYMLFPHKKHRLAKTCGVMKQIRSMICWKVHRIELDSWFGCIHSVSVNTAFFCNVTQLYHVRAIYIKRRLKCLRDAKCLAV